MCRAVTLAAKAREESLDSKREGSLVSLLLSFQTRRLAKISHGKCHRKKTAVTGKGENVW